MALSDKEIGAYVVRAFPDLRAGSRKAILDAFLALRDDYVATVGEAITELEEGGMFLTDSDGNALATQEDNGANVPLVKAQAIENKLDETNLLLRELIESLRGR